MASATIDIHVFTLDVTYDSIYNIWVVVMLTQFDALPKVYRFKDVDNEMVRI